MKTINSILLLVSVLILTSCGHTGYTEDATGIVALGEELKDKFGDDAHYTIISIVDSGSTGDIINTSVTDDPSSNKMEEWTSLRGAWTQNSEITLELPEGMKAEQYMFQIGGLVKMEVLGNALEDAKSRLKKEKDIDGRVKLINITAPDNGDLDSMKYFISLEPENGGTSFTFRYELSGAFIDMDY